MENCSLKFAYVRIDSLNAREMFHCMRQGETLPPPLTMEVSERS
jgi:hypothetical protein